MYSCASRVLTYHFTSDTNRSGNELIESSNLYECVPSFPFHEVSGAAVNSIREFTIMILITAFWYHCNISIHTSLWISNIFLNWRYSIKIRKCQGIYHQCYTYLAVRVRLTSQFALKWTDDKVVQEGFDMFLFVFFVKSVWHSRLWNVIYVTLQGSIYCI